ncbi:hypothetical protein Q3G72_031081 [Acer saccharum]|nr:hypothetical protein Q3G72_031081 [Acer saccharum]
MKKLINVIRYGALSTLDEQIQDSTLEDESTTQIRSEYEAKAAATKIFKIVGIATSKFLLFVSSQLVVVAFIVGNSCKTVFEAIIFLFVMQPFDMGDRCEIEGVQFSSEMNILTTIVFLRYDNQKIIYPNSVLATNPISNYYCSHDMGDAVEFCVHLFTPAQKIITMKGRIIEYIEEKKKDHWYSPHPRSYLRMWKN